MDRKTLLKQSLQRGHLLTLKNQWYKDYLQNKIIPLISEDFVKGDLTTDLIIKKDFTTNAFVISKQNGIIAGLEEAGFLYSQFGIKVTFAIKDGSVIKAKDIVLKLRGNIKSLLKTERAILDLISRVSGIAEMTYQIRQLAKDKIAIAATRKTLLPYLDKKAVYVGGGLTHRLALWDGVLIKDNHFAVQKNFLLKETFFAEAEKGTQFIEVEVKNNSQALAVVSAFMRYKNHNTKSKLTLIIMFDNMNSTDIKNMIKKIYSSDILFEASGNITEKNIKEYAYTGIDCASLGMLTHSVKALDLTQKIKC